MQLWPAERADQEVLWLEEGGGSVGGGLFSSGGPIVSSKRGRDRICSKLQEADEVLIC